MAIDQFMDGYKKVGSIYVREDQKAVGFVSPEGTAGLLTVRD